MERLELIRGGFFVRDDEPVSVIEEPPELPQEAAHSVNALGIPRLGLLDRAEEHLVKSQGISTICVADIIRVDDIEHRLAHLLDRPAADIFPVFEDEFGIGIFRPPFSEELRVEPVVVDKVDVHVDFGGLIGVLESAGNEGVCAHNPVNEVGASLDHTLVDKLSERLILTDIAEVIEELVPETGIDEVAGGVLGASDIQIDIAPICIGLGTYKLFAVVRVHIPEVICARPCKARHRAGFQRMTFIRPVLCARKRRFSGLGRLEFVDFRKRQGQPVHRKHLCDSVFVIYRERLSPISLA